MIIYSVLNLLDHKLIFSPTRGNSILGGSTYGFLSGLVETGGPIRGAILTAFGLEKEEYISTSGAIIKAKLEPYLGFLHSVQHGKPSLVCDLEELYRYLVDGFVIDFCQSLKQGDFTSKVESVSRSRKGKRVYLNDVKTREFMALLDDFFDTIVDIPRIKYGNKQSISSLINEESILLTKYH